MSFSAARVPILRSSGTFHERRFSTSKDPSDSGEFGSPSSRISSSWICIFYDVMVLRAAPPQKISSLLRVETTHGRQLEFRAPFRRPVARTSAFKPPPFSPNQLDLCFHKHNFPILPRSPLPMSHECPDPSFWPQSILQDHVSNLKTNHR